MAALRIHILGAGLMGRLLAHALGRLGHRVRVFEASSAEHSQSAAHVAAAMLAPLAESAVAEAPVVQMGLHALRRWPALLAELPSPVFFQQTGTLLLWHRPDAAHAQQLLRQMARGCAGLSGLAQPEHLDGPALAALEPGLAGRFGHGIWLPGEGQLDNRQLLAALGQSLIKQGAELHWETPMDPHRLPPGAADGPDWLLDCRGLGAKPQHSDLRGVRGEVLRLHAPHVRLSRPVRLVHPRYPLYIAPKEDGVFVVGATEIESEDRSPVSARSTLELLSAAYSVDPGFGEARMLELSTQLRPTLPRHLPRIRALGPRSLQINGLYRHGFLVSPAVLDATLAWVQDGDTTLAQQFSLLEAGP